MDGLSIVKVVLKYLIRVVGWAVWALALFMFGGLVTISLIDLFGGVAVIVPSYGADSFEWQLASVEYYTAYLWLTLVLFIPATISLLLYKWINKWVFWGIMAVVFAVEIFMRMSYSVDSPPEWILF